MIPQTPNRKKYASSAASLANSNQANMQPSVKPQENQKITTSSTYTQQYNYVKSFNQSTLAQCLKQSVIK